MFKIKHTIYCILIALFAKPKYIYNNSTKFTIDIKYKLQPRWINPLNWIFFIFDVLWTGVSGFIENYKAEKDGLGTFYTMKYTLKKETSAIKRWWYNFHQIYGV